MDKYGAAYRAMAFTDAVLAHDVQNAHSDCITVAAASWQSSHSQPGQVPILCFLTATSLHLIVFKPLYSQTCLR